mgnify:CR=1 FL=1
MRRPKQLNYIQKKLINLHYHIYASTKYLEKYGHPKNVRDLNKHKFITYGRGGITYYIWTYLSTTLPRQKFITGPYTPTCEVLIVAGGGGGASGGPGGPGKPSPSPFFMALIPGHFFQFCLDHLDQGSLSLGIHSKAPVYAPCDVPRVTADFFPCLFFCFLIHCRPCRGA